MDGFDFLKKMNNKEEQPAENNDEQSKPNPNKKKLFGIFDRGTLTYKIIFFLVFIFIVGNVAAYTTVLFRHVAFRPYPVAKAILSTSMYTSFYVMGIGKALGPDTPVLIPFEYVRDKLYQTGIQFIPEDDAEREIWWYSTQYLPEDVLYEDKFWAYVREEIELRYEKVEEYYGYTDKVYEILNGLANKKKLEDKFLKKYRLKIFASNLAFDYLNKRHSLFSRLNKDYFSDEREIKRVRNIVDWYVDLREYTKLNEPKGYNFLNRTKRDRESEPILLYLAPSLVLKSEILSNKNICDSELLDLYIDSRNRLKELTIGKSYNSYTNKLLRTKRDSSIIKHINNKCGKNII